MITYKLQKKDNLYFTESILTEEEWFQVLLSADNVQHRRQLDVLRMFLCQPNHKGTCFQVGKEYSMSVSAINMLVQHFGMYVQRSCGKKFRVECYENTDDTIWPVTMLGRSIKGGFFEWELRPELVKALQRFLVDKLFKTYRELVISEGLNNQRSYELYKWQLISSAKGRNTEDIVRILVSKECNFIEKPHAGATIIYLLEASLEAVVQAFDKLLQNKPLDERLQDFNIAAKKITPIGKSSFGDERTAAAFLACIDPQSFAPYTSTIYETYCKYLGIPVKSPGRKYSHFLELLKDLILIEQRDAELQAALHGDTDMMFWSDLLNAQDVLWQTQYYMRSKLPRNWLQQIYDEAIRSGHWVFEDWYPEYKKSIERFRDMFVEGKTAVDVDDETKDYFIRVPDNYISSNLQGMYSSDEYDQILTRWPEMYEIFKRNIETGTISREDYDEMDRLMKPGLVKKHPAAFHRLWAGLFPSILTTTISDSKFRSVYERVRHFDSELPASTGRWLEDNKTLMTYFNDKVSFKEPLHRGLFAWYLYENLKLNENNTDMDKYIDLLKANHNLVLTGAPGTGKTYLANEIAKAMGCSENEMGFVQFHPSYDYADFVEGLRPIIDDNGNVGFERKDGVFKEFCAKALENLLDSQKSLQTLQEETSVRDLLEDFIQDAIEAETQFETQGTKNVFHIIESKAKTITIEIPKNEKTRVISLPKSDLVALLENKVEISGGKDIQIYFNRKYRTQQDSYTYVLYEKLKSIKSKDNVKTIAPIPKKDFVFIIDEINRGELSKIFGELFFAIDPGYREQKVPVMVKTQYQNMVEPGDPFDKGFFIPENVYIIGTMNDIDRGVESMDFAIRRRFAWVEVKVKDRVSMLDDRIPEWSEAAKRCMTSLNSALEEKGIGLTSAYDIGPAYFLKLEKYDGDFEKLWDYHIKGIVTEYLRGTRGIEEKLNTLKEAFDTYKA